MQLDAGNLVVYAPSDIFFLHWLAESRSEIQIRVWWWGRALRDRDLILSHFSQRDLFPSGFKNIILL